MFIAGKKIFIEASLFLAFIDRANLEHLRAVKIFEHIAREKYQAYTSTLVAQQTFNRVEKDMGFTVALEFLQAILESNIEILNPTKSELVAAFKFLKLSKKSLWPLPEVINADLMVKNRISYVATFDSWGDALGTKVSEMMIG